MFCLLGDHFVFDHAKWVFYAASCYTWLSGICGHGRGCTDTTRSSSTAG
ncbi:hypothetical protein [Nonomuraea sp. NPDC046570]